MTERDDEDRNPHAVYAMFVLATALGLLAVLLGVAALVMVFR